MLCNRSLDYRWFRRVDNFPNDRSARAVEFPKIVHLAEEYQQILTADLPPFLPLRNLLIVVQAQALNFGEELEGIRDGAMGQVRYRIATMLPLGSLSLWAMSNSWLLPSVRWAKTGKRNFFCGACC